jgi:hypothetical protein
MSMYNAEGPGTKDITRFWDLPSDSLSAALEWTDEPTNTDRAKSEPKSPHRSDAMHVRIEVCLEA